MIIPIVVEKMDTQTIELACRFAYGPNALHQCGENGLAQEMRKFIAGGKTKIDLGLKLRNFPDLSAYTQTISQKTDLPVSLEVMEAYWFGSSLLESFIPGDYNLLLENYKNQAVKSPILDILIQKQPDFFVPNHLFHVINVNKNKDSLTDWDLPLIKGCMVSLGQVRRIMNGKASVYINPVPGQVRIARLFERENTLPIDEDFVPNLQESDLVAVHLGKMVKQLTKEEADSLGFWTRKIMESML